MMKKKTLRIATRNSPLAMWQTNSVAQQLKDTHQNLEIEILGISTKGDQLLDSPLSKIGGKGLFVKELENALLHNQADIAVHSMKDVPAELPPGLSISVVLERDDPRDALVCNHWQSLDELPHTARIGSSSLRRQMQIASHHPGFQINTLRGNVQTRLRKLDENEFDGIILACAGLRRLKMENRIAQALNPEICLPAVGQGIMGIETRIDDHEVMDLIQPLENQASRICVTAERAMNHTLNGGCQVPIAGYAEIIDNEVFLRGKVGYPDGKKTFFAQASAPIKEAEALGHMIATKLLNQGADKILAEFGLIEPH